MRTRLVLAVLPLLVCCDGSSDHATPTSDAAAPSDASGPQDARLDASSAHDAGAGDQGGDAKGNQTADDASTSYDGDAGACAGPTLGTWRDSANSVQLKLNEDCSFAFSTPTCAASGTATPIDSATGTATLIVTNATGDSSADAGARYPCFTKRNYVCIFQGGDDSLKYYCMQTGVAAPETLTR